MYGIFVNQIGGIPYATLIAEGYKKAETRNKDMLKSLIGERVAIVRTYRGKRPIIIGYVNIVSKQFVKACDYHHYREFTCVPEKSLYDVSGKGKWLYWLENAEKCTPYELPKSAIYHGRSYCEF